MPLKLQQIWAILIRLEFFNIVRDLALLNLAIESKVRGCDIVALKVNGSAHGNTMQSRAMIAQKRRAVNKLRVTAFEMGTDDMFASLYDDKEDIMRIAKLRSKPFILLVLIDGLAAGYFSEEFVYKTQQQLSDIWLLIASDN
jgi:hypothetical protein